MSINKEEKDLIQQVYREWLANNKYKPRYPQRLMIASIAKAIAEVEQTEQGLRSEEYTDHVALIEAGTGTGKTIAYAISAIAMAKALDKKVVISTATIALQEQLIFSDIPNLVEHSSLDFSFALAKGRQRYLCLSKLGVRLQEADGSSPAGTLFPDEEVQVSAMIAGQFSEMASQYEQGSWSGDIDGWDQNMDFKDWRLVAADRSSCTGKKCPHYHRCALFEARDEVRKADVIVANHDLVLADSANGGGGILPPQEDTIYIFDEAHHLPSKSQNHHQKHIMIGGEERQLDKSRLAIAKSIDLILARDKEAAIKLSRTLQQIDEGLQSSFAVVKEGLVKIVNENSDQFSKNNTFRFMHGEIPDYLLDAFKELSDCYALRGARLQTLSDQLLESFSQDSNDDQIQREAAYSALGDVLLKNGSALSLCRDYGFQQQSNSSAPVARWLVTDDFGDVAVWSAPLSTSQLLVQTLWSQCFAAILTSATLAALGSFEYFIQQVGAGTNGCAQRILGALNFEDSILHVPRMRNEPSNVVGHTQEVAELIPELMSKKDGTLVLFASRKQMEEVLEILPATVRELVLIQGQGAKNHLIKLHKERIDSGAVSLLFGLSSFSEGLDLPGNYCSQVIISKLPFSVPDNPVDEAMGEWIEMEGGNAFWDISVPQAAIRLHQACGRLLRKESDTGRVSLLDIRFVKKRYGQNLLDSLPPFKLAIDAQ